MLKTVFVMEAVGQEGLTVGVGSAPLFRWAGGGEGFSSWGSGRPDTPGQGWLAVPQEGDCLGPFGQQ